jgi:hypothetical protein
MDKVIVRIWDRNEYKRRDDNGYHLGKFTAWHAAILPSCDDYITIDGQEQQIIAIERRIFTSKFGKLIIDIIVQYK